jgi:hypothetical protein
MKRACDYIAQDILGRSAQELSQEGISITIFSSISQCDVHCSADYLSI